MKHKLNLKEIRPGVIEFDTWPSGAEYLMVIVYKPNGQQMCWGARIYPSGRWTIYLRSAEKRGYNQVELWSDFWGDNRSEMIGFGKYRPAPEKQSWAKTAIEYKKLANHFRQRAAVHQSLAKKAKLHMRPVGLKAHTKVVERFKEFQLLFTKAIKDKVTVTDKMIAELKKEEAQIHKVACGKDGTFPPAPAQKWYKDGNGDIYLKAKYQVGFDRRPHTLYLINNKITFFYHDEKRIDRVGWCTDKNWNQVARSQAAWKPLRLLKTPLKGVLYIKVGKDITVFDIPKK